MPTREEMDFLIQKIRSRLSDVVCFDTDCPNAPPRALPENRVFNVFLKKHCKDQRFLNLGPTITVTNCESYNVVIITNPKDIPAEYFEKTSDPENPVAGKFPIKLAKLGFLDTDGDFVDIIGEEFIHIVPAEKKYPAYVGINYKFHVVSCESVFAIISHLANASSSSA